MVLVCRTKGSLIGVVCIDADNAFILHTDCNGVHDAEESRNGGVVSLVRSTRFTSA